MSRVPKSDRGVVLTQQGVERLEAAIAFTQEQEQFGQPFTEVDISDRANLSTEAVQKIRDQAEVMDENSIRLLFSTFGLKLLISDYEMIGRAKTNLNSSSSNISSSLSPRERLNLIRLLNSLPYAQFDEIVFALKIPPGIIPPNTNPQGNRSKILLDWAEGPTGHGISEILNLLKNYPELEDFSTSQIEIREVHSLPEEESKFGTLKDDHNDEIKLIQDYCRQNILSQYSHIRLLSGEEIRVDQLYVDVWLLNRSPRTFQVSSSKMLETFDLRNDRLGLGDRIRRRPGLEVASQNKKLIIFGKPGSGKTTFIRQLAIDWCNDLFQERSIAVLIELRKIRNERWNLVQAVIQEMGMTNPQGIESFEKELSKILNSNLNHLDNERPELRLEVNDTAEIPRSLRFFDNLSRQGKLLILLDGLDEISTPKLRNRVQEQIKEISEKYPKNRYVLTCRTQVMESIPNRFTAVEVADFSLAQAEKFIENWFASTEQSWGNIENSKRIIKAAINDHPDFRELTATPVLLSLLCLVLQDEGEIPKDRTRLYKKGIRLMLKRWNNSKQIDGWQIGTQSYLELTIEDKETLLVNLAGKKFDNPHNFVLFEEEEISLFFAKSLNLKTHEEGVAVLKAIEAQHGLLIERADELWSFSHLTFQEYFAAQWLRRISLEELSKKIIDLRWQELIQNLAQTQQPIDQIVTLIQQAISRTYSKDLELQEALQWVFNKAQTSVYRFQPAAVRLLYFVRTFFGAQKFDEHLELILMVDKRLAEEIAYDLDLELVLILDRSLELSSQLELDLALNIQRSYEQRLYESLTRVCSKSLDKDLLRELNFLRKKIQKSELSQGKNFRTWWLKNGQKWTENFRQTIIRHRDIGHNWNLPSQQFETFKQFYDVNKFLVRLLNTKGAVSDKVHASITDMLFLPSAEARRQNPALYDN
jgi:predicted NACHT family NTPase